MTQKQLLALVRKLINDEQATGFTEGGNLEEPEGTQELLNYLDRAVDEYSKQQAAAKNVKFIKRMTVSNGASLPDDFIDFCGAVPINIEGSIMNYYGEVSTLPVRYFARLPYVTSYGENVSLPYNHDDEMKIAALAAIYALNKQEFNVSQDVALLGIGATPNADTQQ